jgi:hypothetical protein
VRDIVDLIIFPVCLPLTARCRPRRSRVPLPLFHHLSLPRTCSCDCHVSCLIVYRFFVPDLLTRSFFLFIFFRFRLREEVEILQHLANTHTAINGPDMRHPNVLAYIDSWEQDEALYIQTELCEFGNFAHFLWEYGRTFPRLDEARVWKIIADLSNVRLRYFSLCP